MSNGYHVILKLWPSPGNVTVTDGFLSMLAIGPLSGEFGFLLGWPLGLPH